MAEGIRLVKANKWKMGVWDKVKLIIKLAM
jgi:hypothetical protein